MANVLIDSYPFFININGQTCSTFLDIWMYCFAVYLVGCFTAACKYVIFHVCVFCVDAVPVMVQHTLMQSSSSGKVTLPPTSFPPTLHHTFLRQQVSYECYSLHFVLKGQFTQSTKNLLLPLVRQIFFSGSFLQ